MLHGGPGASQDYLQPQLLALADTYDCVFYDQRGGGQSRTDDRTPITWRTHVEDIAAVATELAPGPLTLVGFSWGGLLAMLYAIEARAGRVQTQAGRAAPVPARLVLLDPAPPTRALRRVFDDEFTRRQNGGGVAALRAELLASGLKETDPEAFKRRSFDLSVAGYFADPRRAHGLTPFRVIGRVQQSVWESLQQSFGEEYDLLPALAALRGIPSLVVHGRQDPIPLEASEAVANAIGAERHWLDDCGHVPYVEQEAACLAAMRDFLRRTDRIPST